MSATVTVPAGKPGVIPSVRSRLGEASTWAGIGGVALVALSLLPAYVPTLQAAFQQHGTAKVTGLVLALGAFAAAILKSEGVKTIVNAGPGVETVVQPEGGDKVTIATSPSSLSTP